jgi:hypothetical protein
MPRKTLPDNPRLVGALFTVAVLLANVTPALAGGAGGSSGP